MRTLPDTEPDAEPASARRAPPRAKRSRHPKTAIEAYGMLAPSIIGFAVFLIAPIIVVVALSFYDWNLLSDPEFIGLENYRDLAGDDRALKSIGNTFYYVLLNIPAQTVLALALALALNAKIKARNAFRVIYVLPWMAMPVALGVIWRWVFDPAYGALNRFLDLFGVDGAAWLTDSAWAMPVIASVNVWQYTGYTMLFFLAGLQAIPAQLYEAADVDGASPAHRFFTITLPLLRPAMLFVLITSVIGSFQVFDTIHVMTAGGPAGSTATLNYQIYLESFTQRNAGYASMLAVILFAIIALITLAQVSFFRKRTTYDFS
ncbi:carbohydrate ABC transporter permease [Glycomyces harbinensis]|uniref:Multiple sugar transport system permease protein/sn-glycerol 3-phosphate transport system permease protein n=1 Tax=Glycomyces harbinensis TaxID=58114 RepID=A0A1G6ZHD0_9ACTN|nr:sugar ABC transporter permease [Glycomyces harbinensis]SDE02068.1 multiple sugar transport system permease protein/sn-glycerol 3-phosphate transport system permease protein [Glycomyces harbinensis]